MMEIRKVVLVTGASSGFGQLTGSLFATHGYRVFGTSRSPRPDGVEGIEMLALDVRSDDSVRACVERVLELAGQLDVLVNNAGMEHASLIEETAPAHARDVFETNFWGMVRVTNAVLPSMRQRRSGRIINVGSLAGLMGIPGQGFYAASKFAVEGFTESLRLEISGFGIHVSVIEPGFFKTKLNESMPVGAAPISDYDPMRRAVESSIDRAIAQGDDPRKVADAIVRVAETTSPRARYRVGSDAVWTPRLRALLPERLFQRGLRKRFMLP